LRAELAISADMPVILFAGRLSEQKQPRLLAQVMHELARRSHKFICLVAGDGEDRPLLERFLRSNRLDRVRLLGTVSTERMRELMAMSDILFLPSRMEGISLAIYEAMAMGVVPVSANVGGQNELVTPECGILVNRGPDEREAYVEALESLLQNRDRRIQMGQTARQRICENFRIEQMGHRMVGLIQHAHDLAHQEPRPPISPGLAHEIATLAIEYTRVEQVADHLAKQQDQLGTHIKLHLARRARDILRIPYGWALGHGMTLIVPLRDRVYTPVSRWLHSSHD
jgi:hypothetical protein